VPVILLVGGLFVAMRSSPAEPAAHVEAARLPWAYWLPWILAVTVIAVEFFVIVWGGTLVERQTGVSLADATLTISVFIAGLIGARVVMSVEAMGRLDPMLVIRAGLVVSFVAVLVPWLSGNYLVSAAGLLAAGFGIGVLYPPAASIALAAVPEQSTAASARLVSAAGVAILVAPLVLGMVADLSDITTAWLLVPAACVGALALTVSVERARAGRETRTGQVGGQPS
jgi:fucose permease